MSFCCLKTSTPYRKDTVFRSSDPTTISIVHSCVSKGYFSSRKSHWNLYVYVCRMVSVFSDPLKVSISCKESRSLLVKLPCLVTVIYVSHSHSIPRRVVTFWSVLAEITNGSHSFLMSTRGRALR